MLSETTTTETTTQDAPAADDRGLCIAVLERGFVYVGQCTVRDGWLHIEGARCVRRWGTSNGLGQLATEGPHPTTRLDAPAAVAAPLPSVISLIHCTPEAWS